jgi:hypothetical protein
MVYKWGSQPRIVVHICNEVFVVPLSLQLISVLDGQCWLLDCDGGVIA